VGHIADVAHDHKSPAVKHGELRDVVAYLRPDEGRRSLWVLGELLTYKVPSHRTGGAYSLFKVATQPGAGPPPHIHHREDESFYVLEGEYEFLVENRTIKVGAGSLLYFPKGTLHAHKNFGEEVGRMLMSQTPGGLYERFFERIGDEVRDPSAPTAMESPPDEARLAAIAAEYGIEVTRRRGQGGPARVPEH
jgi:mannose-6-phosphate isomerase-like protein (cupin superfamily)